MPQLPAPASLKPELLEPPPDVPLLEVLKPEDVEEKPLVPNDEEPLVPPELALFPLDVRPELEDWPEDVSCVSPEEDPSSVPVSYVMSSFPMIALQPKMQATKMMPPMGPARRGIMTTTL